MRFIGHSMALPGVPPVEAARTFAQLGLVGTELICQEGTPFDPRVPLNEARAVGLAAREAGAPVVTLTPYTWELGASDRQARRAARQLLYTAIDLAGAMRARFVRVLAGREVTGPDRAVALKRLAHEIRLGAIHAVAHRVTLLIENHMETMARSGKQTAELLKLVRFPGVKALYDPANVMWDVGESWRRALADQSGRVGYVHIKDYALRDGQRIACPVGDGVVPWEAILPVLERHGVGYASFEYEARWHPEQLPPASAGLPQSLVFCEAVLALEEARIAEGASGAERKGSL